MTNPSEPPPLTQDELVAALDARAKADGERWELYRQADGGWRAFAGKGPSDPAARSEARDTIQHALLALWVRPRLPVIPHEPPAVAPPLRVEKDGSRWGVYGPGGIAATWSPTKREATKMVETFREGYRSRWEAWQERYATLVATGTEGVDFYWEPGSR
jgi:hypothetical protein